MTFRIWTSNKLNIKVLNFYLRAGNCDQGIWWKPRRLKKDNCCYKNKNKCCLILPKGHIFVDFFDFQQAWVSGEFLGCYCFSQRKGAAKERHHRCCSAGLRRVIPWKAFGFGKWVHSEFLYFIYKFVGQMDSHGWQSQHLSRDGTAHRRRHQLSFDLLKVGVVCGAMEWWKHILNIFIAA